MSHNFAPELIQAATDLPNSGEFGVKFGLRHSLQGYVMRTCSKYRAELDYERSIQRWIESRINHRQLFESIDYFGSLVVCADKEPPQVAGVPSIEECRSKVLVGTLHFLQNSDNTPRAAFVPDNPPLGYQMQMPLGSADFRLPALKQAP